MKTSVGQIRALWIWSGLTLVDATQYSLGLADETVLWPWAGLALETGPLTYALRLHLMRYLEVLDRPRRLLPFLRYARRQWAHAAGDDRAMQQEIEFVYLVAFDLFEDATKAFGWLCTDNPELSYGAAPFDHVGDPESREEVTDLIGRIAHGIPP